jgi:hypothetical protein
LASSVSNKQHWVWLRRILLYNCLKRGYSKAAGI